MKLSIATAIKRNVVQRVLSATTVDLDNLFRNQLNQHRIMKRSLYLIALLGLLFILPACQKEDATTNADGLTSPSGVRLADNYDVLSDNIEGFVQKNHNKAIEASIQEIVWETVNGVDIAFVRYKDQSGEVYNLAMHAKGEGAVDEAVNARIVQTVTCKNVSCAGNCILVVDTVQNQVYYQCNCPGGGGGCEVVVTITIVPDTVKNGTGVVVP